ncbi:MAG: nucleotide exchange factor GrpE [Neisseriaceae bacterium]
MQENDKVKEGMSKVNESLPNSNSNVNEDITENLSKLESLEERELGELEVRIAELKDLYVRSQAEIQNIQKRSQEEVKKARDYAISSFAKDIIVVKDYLEMALKDQSGNFDAIKTGVDLTLKQLVQIFEHQMIKEIEPKQNDKLDPHLHQAMSTEEVENQEPNTIVNVMQKGYMLKDRVIRPAMVTVAK